MSDEFFGFISFGFMWVKKDVFEDFLVGGFFLDFVFLKLKVLIVNELFKDDFDDLFLILIEKINKIDVDDFFFVGKIKEENKFKIVDLLIISDFFLNLFSVIFFEDDLFFFGINIKERKFEVILKEMFSKDKEDFKIFLFLDNDDLFLVVFKVNENVIKIIVVKDIFFVKFLVNFLVKV